MRMPRLAFAALAAASALIVAGCGDKTASPDSPLAFVPADTTYLFANLEGTPKPVIDQWAQSFAALGPFYEEMLKNASREFAADGKNPLASKVAAALAAELEGKMSLAGMESIGFTAQARYASYGIGVVPVMRVELREPAALEAFIGRVEARVGEKLPRGTVGEQSYYRVGVDGEELAAALAIQGKHLVMTLIPRGASDALLRQLLGVDVPAKAYDAGALEAFNKERGYLPYGSGFVDVRALTAALLDQRTAIEKEFLAALDIKETEISPVCKTEFGEIAARVPRFVFGYAQLEPKAMDIRATVETDAALAAELKGIATAVPGLGTVGDAVMVLGWSADLAKVAQFVETHAAAIEAKPYQCEALADLNTGWAELRTNVGNPMVIAMAPTFRGAHAALTRFEMVPGGTPVVTGKLAIASENPRALIQLAGNAMPALNTLPLKPNEAPIPLPAEIAPAGTPPAHVAITDKALGIAVGAGEEASLPAFIAAPPAKEPPFLVLGYSGEFFRSMGAFSQATLALEPDAEKRAEAERSMQLMQDLYANAIRHIDVSVVFTDRGAELRETVTLK